MASFGVALGDVENDGDLDALVAIDGGPNQLWLNDGMGMFTNSPQMFTTASSLACAFGDVDRDGDLDIVIGNDGAVNQDQLEVWVNDGTGSFTRSGQVTQAYRTVALSLGDVDGDGDLDLFLGNLGDDQLLLNDGSGLFTESSQVFSNGTSNGGVFVYVRDNFDGAIANWPSEYRVSGLLQLYHQLTAETDHRRSR